MHLDENSEVYWLSVIARSLASFSLQTPDMRNLSLTERAKYLLGVGLSFKDAASMLGSSEASLRELTRQAKGKKKKNAKK